MTDYVAAPATEGLWVDCDTVGSVTPARLATLLAWAHPVDGRKVVGVAGYSALPQEVPDGTLWTPDSLAMVTEAGLQAIWVQHPLAPGAKGWFPSETLGATQEARASAYAELCGFPLGIHGWCDIEGTGGPSYGYAVTWAAKRVLRGGRAGCYHGYELGMTYERLEDVPDFTAYWQAQNQPALHIGRCDCLVQHYPSETIPGFGEVDFNEMKRDARGDLPYVCARLLAA